MVIPKPDTWYYYEPNPKYWVRIVGDYRNGTYKVRWVVGVGCEVSDPEGCWTTTAEHVFSGEVPAELVRANPLIEIGDKLRVGGRDG